jgi:hypothetical protein
MARTIAAIQRPYSASVPQLVADALEHDELRP